MIDDNIQDGDVIIIEKNGIRLQPANPDMDPIYLKNNEVQILGVVSGVVRKY